MFTAPLHHYHDRSSKNKAVGSSPQRPLSRYCNNQIILDDVSQSLHPHKHLVELALKLFALEVTVVLTHRATQTETD